MIGAALSESCLDLVMPCYVLGRIIYFFLWNIAIFNVINILILFRNFKIQIGFFQLYSSFYGYFILVYRVTYGLLALLQLKWLKENLVCYYMYFVYYLYKLCLPYYLEYNAHLRITCTLSFGSYHNLIILILMWNFAWE